MTKTQEHFAIEEAQSEIRTRVLEIRALPDDKLTSELKTERDTLDQKYAAGEVKFRASLKALREGQEQGVSLDTAGTELRELTKRANLGGVFTAAMAGSPTDGAEAEIQKHFGLASNQIPLEMLRIDRGVEERAAATVPGSIGDASQAGVHPASFRFRRRRVFGYRAPDRRGRCCKLPDVVHEAVRPWSVFG